MRKRISKILISILFVLLIIASIYKVSAAESCSVSMNYSNFFGTRQLKSYGNYYMYCLEPGVTLGDTYTKLTPITIDTNNTGWNTTANKKMIKEAYVFCADGATSTGRDGNGDYTLYKQGTKRLSGYDSYSSRISQDFVRYMVGVLFSPRQIAIWNIEEGKTITSYKVKWWNGSNYTNAQYQMSGLTKGYCKFVSGGGMNLVESVNSLFGGYGSDSSAATTTLGTYIKNNKTTSTKYITDANTFLTNVQNGKNGITNETTGTPAADYTTNSTYIYIGPYKIKHAGLTVATVYDNSGNDISSKVDIVNSAKTTKYTNNLPTSEATFYLRIKRSNMPSSIKKVTFAGSSARYIFNLYKLENNRTEQVLLGGNYKKYSTSTNLDLTVDVPLLPKLKVKLYKTNDFKTDSLPGATFNISFTQDGTSLGNFTNKSAGEEVTCEQPIKSNKPIEVKIEEINAPEGYHNFGTVVAKFDYNSTSKSWVFNSTSSDDLVYIKGTPSTTTTLTSAEIGVINKAKIEELILKKVSLNGTKLEGAEFKVTISNGSILDEDGAEIGASKTVTTESDGTINIGAVKVNNLNNKVTVKLQELTAPDGYAKWASDISFNLKYNKSASKWEQDGNITIPSFARVALESKYLLAITKSGNTTSVSIEVPDISDIFENLIIRKVNTNEEPLANAEFKIELSNAKIYSTNSTSTTATTDADGNIEIGRVDVDDITRPVNVTLTELVAPAGYAKYNDPIKVKITYNQTNLSWDAVFETRPDFGSTALRDCYEVSTSGDDGETVVDIKIPDASQIDELKIRKVDQNGDIISGAKMMITDITNCLNPENVKGIEKTTDADGEITFENVIASDINEKITVTLIETQAPVGYKKISGNIVVDFEYDSSEEKWIGEVVGMPEIEEAYAGYIFEVTSEELAGVHGTTCATIMVPDLAQLDDLIISKVDSQNPSMNVSGVKFEVTEIENCANAEDILNKEFETNNGNLSIGKIIFADCAQPLEITIEETASAKGYKKLSEPITITVSYNGAADYDVSIDNGNNIEEVDVIDDSNNKITIAVPNIPIMLVGGIVFNDGQNGESKEGNLTVQDNVYTKIEGFDEGLAGVKVELLDENEEVVAETISAYEGDTVDYVSYNGETYTKTLVKGEYFFGAIDGLDYIPRANYIVRFTYNGQKFVTTEIASDLYANNGMNKTEEIGREEFNNNFRTIPMDELEYSHTEKAEQEGCYDANLLMYEGSETSWVNNNEEEEVRELFAIKSETPDRLNLEQNWQEVWQDNGEANEEAFQLDANCGLRERKLDISLIDDVKDVTVSINGKTTTYNYAQVIDGEVNLNGEKISDNINIEEVEYNQYIYESDYNFRIEDYRSGLAFTENNDVDAQNISDAVTEDDELKVNVKYQLKVNLQTMTEDGIVRVNEIKDYFDPDIYEYVGAYPCDNTNGEITIDLSSNELSKGGNHKIEIDLDFELKIPDELEDTTEGLICTGENYAEITKYSTTDGLIDRDSDPDDMGEYLEDDTDIAPAMEFILKKDTPREISGFVWDDTKSHDQTVSYTMGNGIKDSDGDGEDGINDVIVQLIEIKPIELLGTTYNLEYIWQETRTGNTKVKTMNYTNTGIPEYDNSVAEDGEYEFTGFIPGNYIVRFIYGDGETYDITPNVEEYNGQDYKSTKYVDYNATEYYNEKMNSYSENTSVARDNEARRLEVMAYSVKIDNELGNKIKDKSEEMLENTWMCAETLKINVPVDADNIETASSETTEENSEDYIVLNKINLGLELRPKTKIELEKHITGLYVQTESGQILTDAKADIADILNDRIINNKQGVTDGLITLVSDRNFRNSWRLETDLSELGQGSELEATYTYVVKNIGDRDYLSSTLVNDYTTNNTDDYSGLLREHADDLKNEIRLGNKTFGEYLGGFYYTGNSAGLEEVPTQINEIQEAINNKMSFADDNPDFDKVDIGEDEDSAYANALKNSAKPEEGKIGAYNRRVWRNVEAEDGIVQKVEEMNTIIKSKSGTGFMLPTEKDTSKVVNLQSTITTDGGEYESYLAEITEYTNAAGRADMEIVPENLSYVHSDDTKRSLNTVPDNYDTANERDEFWGESIVITKPTGEDKVTPVQLIVTITFAVAIIGVGALVIKKFALKK